MSMELFPPTRNLELTKDELFSINIGSKDGLCGLWVH
jgi:hypothetical protein